MSEPAAFLPPTFKAPDEAVTTAAGHRRIDVNFAMIPGFRALQLDVHLPEGSGPFPAVVWIHGGGYNMGDRRSVAPWLEAANMVGKTLAAGIAFISIEYRLGYEAVFPAAVHDTNAALRYLARFAKELSIDASRIALWGESAGGHLALLTAFTRDQDFFQGNLGVRAQNPLKIKLVLEWFGATDLNSIIRPMDGSNLSVPDGMRYTPEYFNLGAADYLDPDLRALASPTSHISGATMPVVILHGTADTMVPFQQSKLLHELLVSAEKDVSLYPVEAAEHSWMGMPQAQVDQIVNLSVAELVKHLY